MKRILELLVFATILAVCSADCPGLHGRQNCYQCEGLSNLQVLFYVIQDFSRFLQESLSENTKNFFSNCLL